MSKKPEKEVNIENEKEWRKFMLDTQIQQSKEISQIKSKLGGLEVKVATFGSFFGVVAAIVKDKLNL